MSAALYFAYGSNMLTTRLRARCRSAALRTVARAPDFIVTFNKRSSDGSGKATLAEANGRGNSVIGAVFEIDTDELDVLDGYEGSGYRRREGLSVTCLQTGEVISTYTYVAVDHHADLKPYDWYLALIVAGIAEHGLAEDYARNFHAVEYVRDDQLDRKARQEALAALRHAGFADYATLLPRRSPSAAAR